MKSDMVMSQLDTTEVPVTGDNNDDAAVGQDGREKELDCRVIWTDGLKIDEVVEKAIEAVKEIMLEEAGEKVDASLRSHSLVDSNDVEQGQLVADGL